MPYRSDPTRRNRNIGTPKQGHGKENWDRIPRPWRESVLTWRERHPHTVVTRSVWGHVMPFVVEPTLHDFVHACTVDDLATVLDLLPEEHVSDDGSGGIQGIVLRQPTRKEQRLVPVWARMGYAVEVGGVVGPVVYVEAQRLPLLVRWRAGLRPHDQRELERLQRAADRTETTRRGTDLHFGLEGVRRVQLYHSLPHEVGHWADMFEHVHVPGAGDREAWEALWDRYFQRPGSEREEYAHRYAERATEAMRQRGAIPFERKLDREALVEEGLRLEDFELAPTGR